MNKCCKASLPVMPSNWGCGDFVTPKRTMICVSDIPSFTDPCYNEVMGKINDTDIVLYIEKTLCKRNFKKHCENNDKKRLNAMLKSGSIKVLKPENATISFA